MYNIVAFGIAMVTLTELPRINSRNDIECPGDILPYMCSVHSNSETIELSWRITFPGLDTIYMFVYTNDSERNVAVYRPMNLTARLTQFEFDQDVQSVLEITVLRNVSMNQTLLECRSEDLASENVTVIVNTSSKPVLVVIIILCYQSNHFSTADSFWICDHQRRLQ